MSPRLLPILLSLLFFTLVATLICIPPILADIDDTGIGPTETQSTNPKDRSFAVSVTVADTTAPTTPLLVSPSDGSTTSNNKPQFIWQPSSDDQGIAKYQFWLDNTLLFDNLPTGSTTNSSYTYLYEDNEYKLTSTTALSDGAHTWKVRAFDNNGNSTYSASWTVNIDTTAPLTTITTIGDLTSLSIRSNDAATVPTSPLELNTNPPTISGTSESGATLQLTYTIPSNSPVTLLSTLTGSTFSFTLPVLPTDTIVTFTLVSTDILSNASTISTVKILVKALVIIIPLPTASSTATPSATITGEASPEPTPTQSPPIISIPIPRLSEIIATPPVARRSIAVTRLLESVPLLESIADSQLVETLAETLPALAAAAPAVTTAAVAVQASTSFLTPLLQILSRFFQSLGLIPIKRPRGLIFNSKSGDPIAFATISIIKLTNPPTIETVVSDTEGVYRSVKLSIGQYKIEAVHPEYTFPTHLQPKFIVNPHDYYRGEPFEINKEASEELFLIPMDPISDERTDIVRVTRKIILGALRRIITNLFYPLAFFSLILTLLYPSLTNLSIIGVYLALIINRIQKENKEPKLSGVITDKLGNPLANVALRFMETGTNSLSALISTDSKGKFAINLPPHDYSLILTKNGYVLQSKENDFQTIYISHQGKKTPPIHATMITMDEAFPPSAPKQP